MKAKIICILLMTLLIGTAFPAVGTVMNDNLTMRDTSDDHNNLIQQIGSSSYSQGDWAQQDKLTASDGAVSDLFGVSVCIDGDYAIVGAYYDDSCRGSAYVFKRDGTSWAQIDKLIASDGETSDYFGFSVSIDGDYAIVGAFNDDSNKGSAYVFKRSGSSWIEEAKLAASDGESGDWFGVSVCIDGDYAIVGASGDGDGSVYYSGSAYVFKRSGSSWIQEAKLTASDGESGDKFGNSVSIDGDYCIVGANRDDSAKGSAYVFKKITPDLDCLGSLSWTDVPAGSIVTGSFQIANVGDSDSELSWEIESYPTWGTWTFVPSSGTGLTPEMGAITVAVEVIAPNEVNEEFTGDVKVVNSEDINDFDLIPVLLKTPRNKAINNPFLNWLQSHPNWFPLFQKLIQNLGL